MKFNLWKFNPSYHQYVQKSVIKFNITYNNEQFLHE